MSHSAKSMRNLTAVETSRSVATTRFALAFLAAAFVVALFNHGLVPSMEPRFAEVVREMLAAGEWLIPIKNGKPYVEYPIFYYWLAVLGKLLGLPMTAAIRLPTFISFFGWIYLLGRWQRIILPGFPKYAFQIAGAALPIALYQFSIAQTDGLLACGVLMSLYGYTLCVAKGTRGFSWALWGGLAIATLAKGPVGIACTLPIVFIDRLIVGCSQARQLESKSLLSITRQLVDAMFLVAWFRGLLVLLLITVPWYVVAGINRGWEFVEAVLIYQNVDRYITGYSHQQPWWYYIKTIAYDFFPLSFLLPLGVWVAVKRRSEPAIRIVLLWAGFSFLFFTASGSKQGKYLLPMAPAIIALALIAIEHLWRRFEFNLWQWIRRWSIALVSVFAMLVVFAVPRINGRIGGVDGFQPIREQLVSEPGRLIHYQWPRSLTLYELGAPLPVVRSARELYAEIAAGEIRPGDYILVGKDLLGAAKDADPTLRLIPFPNPVVFELVLETKGEKRLSLLRVVDGAEGLTPPQTPKPKILHWRDEMFDTD